MIFTLLALYGALVLHEAAHAWVADGEGDPSAVIDGRGSLMPWAHLHPFGSVLLPLVLWMAGVPPVAFLEPIELNPKNFRNGWKSAVRVHAAGVAANAVFALFALPFAMWQRDPMSIAVLRVNVAMAVFNLLPVPPLDGWNIARVIVTRTA